MNLFVRVLKVISYGILFALNFMAKINKSYQRKQLFRKKTYKRIRKYISKIRFVILSVLKM